ncbi:MAG TPA: DUF2200 domain-containing protein [Spirochaetia bacterium]|nr:DUF2200 domain-containing protein [Spirochaetales bacterium]HRW25651.1 DUF2200 domain-containing protein [Spirochaetia bacterium]
MADASGRQEHSLERVYRMSFGLVYPLYVRKAEKKGRTKDEVDEVIAWLTGYAKQGIEAIAASDTDLEHFFGSAPRMNPNASKITGVICGHRVEDIEDDVLRKVRYMDKLVDELAKGRPMEKVLRA